MLRKCLLCGKEFEGNYQTFVCSEPHLKQCVCCGEFYNATEHCRKGKKCLRIFNDRKYCEKCFHFTGYNLLEKDYTNAGRPSRKTAYEQECAWCGKHFFSKDSRRSCSTSCRANLSNINNGGCLNKRSKELKDDLIKRLSIKGYADNTLNNYYSELFKKNNLLFVREAKIYGDDKRADFYFPDKKVAVEINPTFSHKIRKFTDDANKKLFDKTWEYHRARSLLGLKNGVFVFHKWDWISDETLLNFLFTVGTKEYLPVVERETEGNYVILDLSCDCPFDLFKKGYEICSCSKEQPIFVANGGAFKWSDIKRWTRLDFISNFGFLPKYPTLSSISCGFEEQGMKHEIIFDSGKLLLINKKEIK